MANYFTLGASLPTLKQGDYKTHEVTSSRFLELLSPEMTRSDKEQMDLILLRNDNHLLMQLLRGDELSHFDDNMLVLGAEKLRYLIDATQAKLDYIPDPYSIEKPQLPPISTKEYPSYMIEFVEQVLSDRMKEQISSYFYEDILLVEYTKYVQKRGNSFLKGWFALEQDIASILAALTAQKYGLDASTYLPGDKPLYDLLRHGEWREISFMEDAEMVSKIRSISEETHLAIREKKLDAFKWELLSEVTFSDIFSINAMMVYLLKLQILERWERLDKVQGEQKFRSIVGGLNHEGREELEKYKETVKIRKKARR